MIAPVLHHPQPPSRVALLALCGALEPDPDGAGPLAFQGSLQHGALVEGDLTSLEGDAELEREVLETAEFFAAATKKFDGPSYRERTLGVEGLNFGTLDILHFNASGTRAYIGDAKFGRWPVEEARKNYQGINYVVLVFENFPRVNRIVLEFYMAKLKRSTRAVFLRKSLPKLRAKIQAVVDRAKRIAAGVDLKPSDFTPHPDVCGFCHRVACPARLKIVSALVTEFAGHPVTLPTLDWVRLTPEQLGFLKLALANPIKTWVAALDAECKRRVFDCDETIPGYEVREKSSKRSVIGAEEISQALDLLTRTLGSAYPDTTFPLEAILTENVELPVGDLQELVSKYAPRGQITRCRTLVYEALAQAKLVTEHSIFYLAMKHE